MGLAFMYEMQVGLANLHQAKAQNRAYDAPMLLLAGPDSPEQH